MLEWKPISRSILAVICLIIFSTLCTTHGFSPALYAEPKQSLLYAVKLNLPLE